MRLFDIFFVTRIHAYLNLNISLKFLLKKIKHGEHDLNPPETTRNFVETIKFLSSS